MTLSEFTEDKLIQYLKDGLSKGVLDRLSRREREVICLRCGFDGPIHTEEAIAERYGVSMDAVQMIVRKAVLKLRRDPPGGLPPDNSRVPRVPFPISGSSVAAIAEPEESEEN